MADMVYGIHPVREGLKGGRRRPLELFLLKEGRSGRLSELAELAEQEGVPVRYRPRPGLDGLAGHPHHQGAVLRVEPFTYASLEDLLRGWRSSGRRAFFLLLDGITDPHNLGALLRSADAAGCHGVIVPRDRFCPVTPVVDKVSAGALEHVPVCQVTNLARTLEELKEAGIWSFALADRASVPLYGADLSGDIALVVGSEGKGVRPNVLNHCDHVLGIPMQGGVSSLNASVAAGIALFEAVRQRRIESHEN